MLLATVVIPIMVLSFAEKNYPELKVGTERMQWILIGCVLSVLSFVEGYNRKGSRERMVAGIIGVFCFLVWLVVLIGGAKFKATLYGFELEIDATRLAMLIILILGLKIVYYIAEYIAYRYKGEAEVSYSKEYTAIQSYSPKSAIESSMSYMPPENAPKPLPTNVVYKRKATIKCNRCGHNFTILRDIRPGYTKVTCPKCGKAGVM